MGWEDNGIGWNGMGCEEDGMGRGWDGRMGDRQDEEDVFTLVMIHLP